jgi:hypothetical protein
MANLQLPSQEGERDGNGVSRRQCHGIKVDWARDHQHQLRWASSIRPEHKPYLNLGSWTREEEYTSPTEGMSIPQGGWPVSPTPVD